MWGKLKNHEPEIQCSLVSSPIIFIESVPRQKMSLLMGEYPHQEWLAYLKGRQSDKGNIFVEELSIPPHVQASGGSAEAEPFHKPEDCVGVVHSHHSMGAFHSGTDQAYVDKNFPVSITVARGKESSLAFDAISYQKTPCGKAITLKCTVKYVQPEPLFDKESFLKEAKENIDKSKKGYNYNLPTRTDVSRIRPAKDYHAYHGDYLTDNEGHVISYEEFQKLLAGIYHD